MHFCSHMLVKISTHSPRVGRTLLSLMISTRSGTFQLTRPVWGEPCHQTWHILCLPDFNSLAPCGANQFNRCYAGKVKSFQLTRPVWGEPIHPEQTLKPLQFQLTRPVWGEPWLVYAFVIPILISTHSPRVGRTARHKCHLMAQFHFNSLAPCGANRLAICIAAICVVFQLTRPVWGEPSQMRR